jgi:PAS domain S-box-containing protein
MADLRQLAGLLENTDDAVIAGDEQFVITAWNHAAEGMLGWRADEVLGRAGREVMGMRVSETERVALIDALAGSGRWRGDLTITHKDGTAVATELNAFALRDPQGAVTGYLSIHRDIRERNRAVTELREARDRADDILESMAEAFVAVDHEWRYTYVNDLGLRRMQDRTRRSLAREDVLGKGMWDLFPDFVGTEIYDMYQEAMRERRPLALETYFAGTDEWLEVHAYPTEAGLSIYYRNVDDRHRTEEARRESQRQTDRRAQQQHAVAAFGLRALAEDELQPLLDAATAVVAETLGVDMVAIAELDAGGVEATLRSGVGWVHDFVGMRGPARGDSLVGYTVASGGPVISDDVIADERFTFSATLASHRPMSAACVVIEGRAGPFGALGACSRVRRSFSRDDVNFLQAVANVVATAVERSRDEARLVGVKEAERRRIARDLHDEALQDLTHALAKAVGAGAESDAGHMVPALKRVGEQLRAAIYDLRLGGKQHVPFPELLEGLVEVHRALAPDRDISLELGAGAPSGVLGATGTELLRIIGEALNNARRHSGAEHVRVRVWGSEAHLCAEVSDDGHGSDTDMPVGTGVTGMRERADLLAGKLEVRTEPGAGTNVRVEIPLEQDLAAEEVRVLLVEDHASVRQAIAAAFERETGFEVVGQASSLAEARTMLAEVDVAILDLGLPDGDGADLVEEIRNLNPRAQALVLSATLDRADVARAVASGAAAVLHKTAELDQLVQAVRRLRAGEALLPPEEVIELLRFAEREEERERAERVDADTLTPREREILQLLADGLGTQTIAERLHISVRTQRNHLTNIFAKLGVHSQLQALVFALRYDIVQLR